MLPNSHVIPTQEDSQQVGVIREGFTEEAGTSDGP